MVLQTFFKSNLESCLQGIALLIWIFINFPDRVYDFFWRKKSDRVPIRSLNVFYVGATASLFLTIRASWRSGIRRSIDHRRSRHRYYFADSVRTSRITLHSFTSTFRPESNFHTSDLHTETRTDTTVPRPLFLSYIYYFCVFLSSRLSLPRKSFIFDSNSPSIHRASYILSNTQVTLWFLIMFFFHEIENALQRGHRLIQLHFTILLLKTL